MLVAEVMEERNELCDKSRIVKQRDDKANGYTRFLKITLPTPESFRWIKKYNNAIQNGWNNKVESLLLGSKRVNENHSKDADCQTV